MIARDRKEVNAMAFTLTSPTFTDGAPIPAQFTCEGKDVPPPLQVAEPPVRTASFALIMDDPDAPRGTFTHWLVYDIPPGGQDLDTAAAKTLQNDFGRQGYGGPCPPPGHGPHRYFFRLYALDVPSLEVGGRGRSELEAALKDHTLAEAHLMGRYERARR
jgi:Raf kinase inhibitor-like YbhB/YbcL family protein